MATRAALDDAASPDPDIGTAVDGLRLQRRVWRQAHAHHRDYGANGFPSRAMVERAVDLLFSALFPLRLGTAEVTPDNEDGFVSRCLSEAADLLAHQVALELGSWQAAALNAPPGETGDARAQIHALLVALPGIRAILDSDVEAAFAGDPAARSVDEVLLCYPSLHAITHHRIAHVLHGSGAPLVARIIAEIAHARTGIDIHPGARIGARFFIDHGAGVVIGETAIIGEGVRLYQGVTLGAKSFRLDADGSLLKGDPRHPIVEDDVVIYAGATVLGRITIGARSVIGGNVWLTESVPPDSLVHQSRPKLVIQSGDRQR